MTGQKRKCTEAFCCRGYNAGYRFGIRSKVSTLGILKFPRHCLLKNSISSFIRQRFIFQFVSVNTHMSEQKSKVIFQVNSMSFAGFMK